jgi:hypothetical protein
MIPVRRLTVAAVLLGAAGFLPGCYAEAEPAYVTSADVDYGYVPAYYDGYVVYYDTIGRPYYYNGGSVVWIPPSSPYYVGLRNHWHAYGHAYPRWYSSYGYRYHGYRSAPGYHGYGGGYRGGAYHAPPAYRGGGHHHR